MTIHHALHSMYSVIIISVRVTSLEQLSLTEFSCELVKPKVYENGHKKCSRYLDGFGTEAQFWPSKSFYHVNNQLNLSDFFFIEDYEFRSTSLYWHCLIASISKSRYFLKRCPILDSSPLILQFSKFNNFIWRIQLIFS